MRFEFAEQYRTACVVIEDGDTFASVMQHHDITDCFYDDGNEWVICVRFPGRPQELYTEDALRRSLDPVVNGEIR